MRKIGCKRKKHAELDNRKKFKVQENTLKGYKNGQPTITNNLAYLKLTLGSLKSVQTLEIIEKNFQSQISIVFKHFLEDRATESEISYCFEIFCVLLTKLNGSKIVNYPDFIIRLFENIFPSNYHQIKRILIDVDSSVFSKVYLELLSLSLELNPDRAKNLLNVVDYNIFSRWTLAFLGKEKEEQLQFFDLYSSLFSKILNASNFVDISRMFSNKNYMNSILKNFHNYSSARKTEVINLLSNAIKNSSNVTKTEFVKDSTVQELINIYKKEKFQKIKSIFLNILSPVPNGIIYDKFYISFRKNPLNKPVANLLIMLIGNKLPEFDFTQNILKNHPIIFFEIFNCLNNRQNKQKSPKLLTEILNYLSSLVPMADFLYPFIPNLKFQDLENFINNYMNIDLPIDQNDENSNSEKWLIHLKNLEIVLSFIHEICLFLKNNKPQLLSSFIGSQLPKFSIVNDRFHTIFDERSDIRVAFSKIIERTILIMENDEYLARKFVNNFETYKIFEHFNDEDNVHQDICLVYYDFVIFSLSFININVMYCLELIHVENIIKFSVGKYSKSSDIDVSRRHHDILFHLLSKFFVVETDFAIWTTSCHYFNSKIISDLLSYILIQFFHGSLSKNSSLASIINFESFKLSTQSILDVIVAIILDDIKFTHLEQNVETLAQYVTMSLMIYVLINFPVTFSLMDSIYRFMDTLDQISCNNSKLSSINKSTFYICKIYLYLCTNRTESYKSKLSQSQALILQEKWLKVSNKKHKSRSMLHINKMDVSESMNLDHLLFLGFSKICCELFKTGCLEFDSIDVKNLFDKDSSDIKLPISYLLLEGCCLYNPLCVDLVSNRNISRLFSCRQKYLSDKYIKQIHVKFANSIYCMQPKSLLTKLYFNELYTSSKACGFDGSNNLLMALNSTGCNLSKYNGHYLNFAFKYWIKYSFSFDLISKIFNKLHSKSDKASLQSKIWYYISVYQSLHLMDFVLKNYKELSNLIEYYMTNQLHSKPLTKTLIILYTKHSEVLKLLEPVFMPIRTIAIKYFISPVVSELSLFSEFIYYFLAFGSTDQMVLSIIVSQPQNINHSKIIKTLLAHPYFLHKAVINLVRISDRKILQKLIKHVVKIPCDPYVEVGLRTLINVLPSDTLINLFSRLNKSKNSKKIEYLTNIIVREQEIINKSTLVSLFDLITQNGLEFLMHDAFEAFHSLLTMKNTVISYHIKFPIFIKFYHYGLEKIELLKIICPILVTFLKLVKPNNIRKIYDQIMSDSVFEHIRKIHKFKESLAEWVHLIHDIIFMLPSLEKLSKNHVMILKFLFSFYKGTLRHTDIRIFRIYFYSAKCLKQSSTFNAVFKFDYTFKFDNMPTEFLTDNFLLKPYEVLSKLKVTTIQESIKNFQCYRKLNVTDDKYVNYQNNYDPSFLLPLLSYLFEYQSRYSDFIHDVLKMGILAYLIVCIASYDDDIRRLSYYILLKFENILQKSKFHQKYQISLLLTLLRNSITQENQRITKSNALLLGKISNILIHPDHELYSFCSHFLSFFSYIDTSKIILLDKFIYGINKNHDEFFHNPSAMILFIDCLANSLNSLQDLGELIKYDFFTIIFELAVIESSNYLLSSSLYNFITKLLENEECAKFLTEKINIIIFIKQMMNKLINIRHMSKIENSTLSNKNTKTSKSTTQHFLFNLYRYIVDFVYSNEKTISMEVLVGIIFDYLSNDLYYIDKYLSRQTKKVLLWLMKNTDRVTSGFDKITKVLNHLITLEIDNITRCISSVLLVYFSILSNKIAPFLEIWPKYYHFYDVVEYSYRHIVRSLMSNLLRCLNEKLKNSTILLQDKQRFDLFKNIVSICYTSVRENHELFEDSKHDLAIQNLGNTIIRTLLLQHLEDWEKRSQTSGSIACQIMAAEEYSRKIKFKQFLLQEDIYQLIDENPSLLQDVFIENFNLHDL